MLWLYFLSLLPIYLVVRWQSDFGWKASYFVILWIGVSLSVFLATYFGLDLVELGTYAHTSYAPIVFNATLAWSLLVSAVTYRALLFVRISAERSVILIDRPIFLAFVAANAAVAVASIGLSPPVLQGMPISQFLASLSAVQRFAFVSLAIAALPVSQFARDLYDRRRLNLAMASLICLMPAVLWAMAGEKFGYLLFVLFLSVLPWVDRLRRGRHLRTGMILTVLSVVALTLSQYALTTEDWLLHVAARVLMQGQLWYYFYTYTPLTVPIGEGLQLVGGTLEDSTLQRMMGIAMPWDLYAQYDTAALTGSHLPALLRAFGWSLFPVAVTLFAVIFGVATTLLRLAVESRSLVLSFLIVGSFVFPGIDVWVVGNTSRLFHSPTTFTIFFILLIPLLFVQLRFRVSSPTRGTIT